MKSNHSKNKAICVAGLGGVLLALGLFFVGNQTGFFRAAARLLPDATSKTTKEDKDEHAEHSEAEHNEAEHNEAEHSEAEHSEAEHAGEKNEIVLDDAALFNIGVRQGDELTLEPRDYVKTFRLPGVVREIPGRSDVGVAATVDGIVSKIEAKEGDALCPGEPLFEIQLTHDEALECQTALISLLQERDALQLEEERLSSLSEGIAPKQLRELRLKQMANDAAISARRDVVKVHGFTDAEIDETIVARRRTITSLIVRVPQIDEDAIEPQTRELHTGDDLNDHYLILEKTSVNKGDFVRSGANLCRISDLRTLQIEGKAFAIDENVVNDALLSGSPISATFPDALRRDASETIDELRLKRVDDRVDQTSQSLGCWIELPNVRLDASRENSARLPLDRKTVRWRFKPGQRCELGVGYETLENVYVLPPDAVAFDRRFAFVFELTEVLADKRVWTKRPVRVLYRAGDAIVAAVDETLRPGTKIARAGAEQLYVALGSGSAKLQSSHNHNH